MNAKRSIINVLDANTINQIAAGEVIERPASIVKELIENAIDAGANHVVIDFLEGGKKRIRVSDNGHGIVREDFSKIFLRHSTSKISSAQDLMAIHSLGFRGEALASIAAIASVQLTSKGEGEDAGNFIQVKGGKQIDFHPAGSNQGTQIVVEDLFFNTPVRRKFLKSTQVESSRIYEVVKRTALSFPAVSLECIRDGRQIFYSSGNGKVEDILMDLQGMHYFEQLFPIAREKDGIRIDGYLSEPNASRGNRNHQYFFLNHRYISSPMLRFALEEAYQPFMMKGRFPIAILLVTLDPGRVDVNVHPTKLEVRFQEEKRVKETVLAMLKEAIQVYNQPKSWQFTDPKSLPGTKDPVVQLNTSESVESQLNEQIARYIIQEEDSTQLELKSESPAGSDSDEMELSLKKVPYGINSDEAAIQKAHPAVSEPTVLVPTAEPVEAIQSAWRTEEIQPAPFAYPAAMIGAIFDTYILAKSFGPESLYLIDQHAAHERILYEAFRNKAENAANLMQQLLQPVVIPLNAVEFELVERFGHLMMKFGVEVETLAGQSIVLRSVPSQLGTMSPQDFFLRLLDEITALSSGEMGRDAEAAIAKAACKAAVKAGDHLSQEEVSSLFEQLKTCKDPFHCPHGRPTMIRLSQAELEKKFGRRT